MSIYKKRKSFNKICYYVFDTKNLSKTMTITNINKTEKVIRDVEYYRNKISIKKKDPEKLEIIFNEIEKTLEKMSESSGLTVEELADVLDPSNSFPF